MRQLTLLATVLGVSLAAAAPPALAQSLEIGPGGVRVNPFNEPRGFRSGAIISPREARAIAREQGLIDIDAVSRVGSRYRVEGMDRRGRDTRVDIDARTGDVVRVVRFRS